jgi:hypothetical protein
MADTEPRMVPVSSLRAGDIVDLAGDRYADPTGDRVDFEFENVIIGAVIPEAPTCTVLCIDGVDRFGFPPDHPVKLVGHDDSYEPEAAET